MGKAVFSNTYGVLTVENVMYSINLTASWDTAGTAEFRTQFSVRGRIDLGNTTFDIGVLAKGGGYAKVGRGSLSLPHKEYPGVMLTNVSAQPGEWVRWGDVVMSLERLSNDPTDHSVTINGVKIFDPKFSISIPAMRRSSTPMPMKRVPARQRLGRSMPVFNISGIVEPSLTSPVPKGLLEYVEAGDPKRGDGPFTVPLLSKIFPFPDEDLKKEADSAGGKPDLRKVVFEESVISLSIETGVWSASLSGLAPVQTMIDQGVN